MISEQFLLNVIVSLAVYDVLVEFFPGATHIKWPNDILVHEKKICGILIENQLRGKTIETSVVGIGLNVNQTKSLPEKANSLAAESNRQFELAGIFEAVLSRLESRYLQLKQQKFELLRADYLRNLYRKGHPHLFQTDSETFTGTIRNVDELGRLEVLIDSDVRYFEVKQIRYL